MALERGTKLGPYQIESPIGAGGMGEVYKATDTRLERTVAIKVLPAHVASDPERKQRFEREAKVISGLNHPHICTLYEFDNHEGTDFLVMEYLEGETLADRLAKGALPLDQALRYAIEIADALDKAHRQGVTHRDLKPANIMLTKAGAKLLDFGLAKLKPTGPQSDASTKLADALTEQGTILGTFQYMAPEQLEGHEADARTDIWAFGCVVYEMVTGKKAFEGKSQASLITAIMSSEPPPPSSVESMSPAGLDYVVQTCLGKDRDDRWQTARDLLRELKRVDPTASWPNEAPVNGAGPVRTRWPRPALALAAATFLMALTGLTVWSMMRSAPPRVSRFVISAESLLTNTSAVDLAISADGSRVVYMAGEPGDRRLVARMLDRFEARPIDTSPLATAPFLSPDGEWIGYRVLRSLQKVPFAGGPSIKICDLPERGFFGASWGPDDTIIFATVAGLWQVSAAGGEPEALTGSSLDGTEDHYHWWPEVLPDGRSVLFTETPAGSTTATRRIAVLSLESGESTVLLSGGSNPHYVPTGHLVYGVDGALWTVPFDVNRLEVGGTPVPVLEGIVTKSSGAADFAISHDGTLVYVRGGAVRAAETRPVWVDAEGRTLQAIDRVADYFMQPRLAADGNRLAARGESPH